MADGEITVRHTRRWAALALAGAALSGGLTIGAPPASAIPTVQAADAIRPESAALADAAAGRSHTASWGPSTAPAVRPGTVAAQLVPLVLAGPPQYEIEGEWIAPPPEVSSGDPVVAQWRVNVNDSGNPPGNDPIADVTATFTVQNGTFDGIPDICKTAGVTTPSSVSPDGLTLSCNFGTVNAGTAISLQTPVLAEGPTGSIVDITGSIGGQTASPPEIPINNPFGMDIRWGPPTTFQDVGDGYRDMDFEWTLSLNRGSDPGPQTIVYNLTISSAQASPIVVGPQACSPYSIDPTTADHPWSGGTHPADRMASFVTSCTLTQTGTTTFQLTLNGINYAPANPPTRSSSGDLLPTDRTVVASGSIWIRLTPTQGSGSVQLSSDAPQYTSTTSQTAFDDAANNTSSKTWVGPGIYSSGWMRAYTGNAGTTWDDTYRVAAGAVVASYMDTALQLHTDRPDNYPVGMCTALDTRYVIFSGIEWWPQRPTVAGSVIEYYTGGDPTLDPASASYDPNAFYCGGTGGWSVTPPADLTQVRAVRVTLTQGQAEQYSYSAGLTLTVYQQIKPDTPTGADVWTAFSGIVDFPGVSDYWNGTPCVTPTPGLRYPCTTGFHDLVRIVSAAPSIQKSTGDSSVTPGVPEEYTLTYSANGFGTLPPTIDGFTIVDTLPLGMAYVPGSATPAPAPSTDPQGRQVLTWTLNGVPTNTEQTLTYEAVVDAGVVPGTPLTNTVTASYDGSTTQPATATVVTSTNGYTTILKTADDQQVQLDGTGTATLPWTVTVRSFDPIAQAFTDTIDILPYNGDGRGTAFTGTSVFDSVVAPGATVYYTTAAPAGLSDDPDDAANGAAGNPAGNTVGWTTTAPADLSSVTAIRVIGPALPAGATYAFQVLMATSGAAPGDVYVNRSQAIAEHTGLAMRTSAMIELYEDALVKDLSSLTRNADGTYTAVFTISNTRTGNGPGYDLSDTLQYGDSVTLVGSPTAANTVPGDGSVTPVNTWNGATDTLTIADDVPIADGVTHSYTVTSIVSIDGGTVDWASTDCTLQGGETGTGLQNTATLDVEDVEQTASDCAELPYTTHEKSVTGGPTPIGNGLYEVEYTIDVRNLGAAPDVYDLADDFRFGAAVTIVGTPTVANSVPGGIVTLGTWDAAATTLAIVDDQPIGAATSGGPTMHSYVVTVQVAVDAPAVTFANSDCTADGGESGTGLDNQSTLTVADAYVTNDDACVPISEPVHVKTVVPGSPTPLGDGTYRVEYSIDVTNAGAAASVYDLDDQFQFGPAVIIVGTPIATNTAPGGIATLGTWDGATTTLDIVAGQAIAAGTAVQPVTHTYTVTVIVDVDAPAVTFTNSDCALDAGESGTGLRNASTMTVNGEGAEQTACPPISEPTHTKTVSAGPTPLGNNHFQVDYAITVTNAGAAASTYDLIDDFQFGPAVTIVGTPTVTNTVPGGIPTLGTWNAANTTLDIVAAQPIAAGSAGGPATHTYIVSVVVTADLPLATPSNSDCVFDQGEDGTGLFNQSTLTVNGDDADDDACLEFPRPIIDHTKTLTGITPNGDGTYTAGYSVVVTNSGAGAGIYDLTDTLQYGAGVRVVGQPTVTADPGGVALIPGWNGTSATGLVDDQPIDPVSVHTYTLTVVVRPDPGTTIGGATDCTLEGGESGTGVRNESHLTAPGGVDQVRNACGELPHFVIDKAISAGPTDLGNGQYQLGYTITVTNDGAGAGAYDLADHLTYGSSVTIASVSIANTAPGGIGTNPGWNGTGDTTVVTGVGLAAGGTHTYTVTVLFSVAVGATGTSNDCTLDPGESGTGLLNTATVNNNGTEESDVACALVLPPPPPPTTTVPPPAPTVPPTSPDPGHLPATGGNSAPIGLLAVMLVLAGALVLAATRRKRRPAAPVD